MQFQAMVYTTMLLFIILLLVTGAVDAFKCGDPLGVCDEEKLSDALQKAKEKLEKW